MNNYLSNVVRANVMAIVMTFAMGSGQSMLADGISTPPVPPGLEVPDGNTAYLKGHAVGTQNYICMPSGSGFAWSFLGPQATLFVSFNWIYGEVQQQVTTHFLSPNPDEGGLARATWQSSLDTSAVWGKAIASSTDSAFVLPGAIPWLLVQIVGIQPGPSGGEILGQTTYIQRLNTSGGVAPATGCSESANVGTVALMPYTTDYFFYKARRRR